MEHLPIDVRAAIRFFAFYIANGTVDLELLDGIDYKPQLMASGSALEMVFAIFTNVLRIDEAGKVVNEDEAQERAAQWIRAYCDREYRVDPPFEAWETELHL
ncbi:hypothetical protein ACFWPH_06935 [Nocardia sp. NPDC058499]|uniref:DUF7677 family protein n=1 Tax=Nocardia sp. NPDC058499 TaxID=3346530 RepID=UPI0036480C7E